MKFNPPSIGGEVSSNGSWHPACNVIVIVNCLDISCNSRMDKQLIGEYFYLKTTCAINLLACTALSESWQRAASVS